LDFVATARPTIDIYDPAIFQQELFWVGFVTWLADYRKIRMLSGRHYLYGIQTLLLEAGCHVSILRSKLVRRALKAWGRREGPSETRPKVPITVSMLQTIRPCFNFLSHHDRVIWAMACLAVYGLLRCGEITTDAFDHLRYPTFADWTYDANGLIGRFRLGSSKTDVFFQGTYVYVAANGTMTCPMAAMRSMISLAPFKWSSTCMPLFSFDGFQPISRGVFLNAFRNHTKHALDPSSFSGHSFRRGGAQSFFFFFFCLLVLRTSLLSAIAAIGREYRNILPIHCVASTASSDENLCENFSYRE
jgi:hypothetical protein